MSEDNGMAMILFFALLIVVFIAMARNARAEKQREHELRMKERDGP